MKPTLNIQRLRSISSGDVTTEQEIFKLFVETTEKLLKSLKKAANQEDFNVWKECAHELKGVSHNLGAERLGELSIEAELIYKESIDAKLVMFDMLSKEAKKVIEQWPTEA